MRSHSAVFAVVVALGLTSGAVMAQAQPPMGVKTQAKAPAKASAPGTQMPASAEQALGSVRLPRAVTANGEPLPAGTYTVRLTGDAVTPVVGQPAGSERWVEFLQNGQVRGKELASVVPSTEVRQVAESALPAAGSVRVQPLKGADYLRVWINRGGTHYLVHLSTVAK